MEYSKTVTDSYYKAKNSFNVTDKRSLEILNEIGVSGKRILDFGCGDGRYAILFRDMGAAEVIGIDSSAEMISRAREAASDINFIEAGGEAIPFEDGYFQVVFANFVLHHFKNVQSPIAEVARVLANGGYFLATFNTFELSDPVLYNTEIPLRLGDETVYTTVHNLAKADSEMQEALVRGGFDILSFEEINHPFCNLAPSYEFKSAVIKVKTIICLAQKVTD
ncbi:MAG: class I SAM-dependent methyltransferase [bacterium]